MATHYYSIVFDWLTSTFLVCEMNKMRESVYFEQNYLSEGLRHLTSNILRNVDQRTAGYRKYPSSTLRRFDS